MKKKFLLVTVAALVVLFTVSQVYAQGSKFIMQQVIDTEGNIPNFENDEVTFKAWITERPDYILDETSTASRTLYNSETDKFFVYLNAGNFPGVTGSSTDWSPGETLKLEVMQGANVIFTEEFTLSEGSSPQIRHAEFNRDEHNSPEFVTRLDGNYPNPFNPVTNISFSIAEEADVKLEVFNSRGQRVITLVDDALQAGHHNVVWHGKNSMNREVGSGMYFYRLQKGDWSETEKMLLIK